MTKTELESKHLSELHALAAEAGIDRYRMLPRPELIEQLAGGDAAGPPANRGGDQKPQGDGPKRRRRRRSGSKRPESKSEGRESRGSDEERDEEPQAVEPAPSRNAPPPPPPAESAAASGDQEAGRPKRRRRRRFGRRKDQGVTLTGLLLPPEPGRQTVLCAETREACTALLRGVAADLAGADKGPDPIALLIDPSPEELADWKREAPQAEIVAAGQARHADDALAAAIRRAGSGEDVILLVDSLNRLGEAHGDSEAAKEFFDSGRAQGAAGGGSLTVVAALERGA
jgi:transcription termination factor Rho